MSKTPEVSLRLNGSFGRYEVRDHKMWSCRIFIYTSQDRLVFVDCEDQRHYPRPATREEYV
jgi:hypothetical protein